MKKVRVGAGSAFWGDMLEPAVELAEKGNVNYIGFDHLAELTLAILQRMRSKNPESGYIPDLIPWTKALLPITSKNGAIMITDAGGANPGQAGEEVVKIAKGLGLEGMKVGVVTGDDLSRAQLSELRARGWKFKNLDTGEEDIDRIEDLIVAANAYIGADGLIECLQQGANMVIAGRCSDNALYVAPVMKEFGWDYSNKYVNLVAAAVTCGHIIECTSGCTGGMSNLWRIVKNAWRIGFPVAEFYENGEFIITKPEGSGGLVSEWNVKEHLVYEIQDPNNYMMPDGIADFTSAKVEEVGKDRVKVSGIKGKPRPDTLKVCIGFRDGFIGEGHVFFSWPDALEKAKWAEKWMRERIKLIGIVPEELQIDYIGLNVLHGTTVPWPDHDDDISEIGLRIVAKTKTYDEASAIRREASHLWTAGPVGSSFGVPFNPRPIIALWPTLIPREELHVESHIKEVK
jgi:hypothetical protein